MFKKLFFILLIIAFSVPVLAGAQAPDRILPDKNPAEYTWQDVVTVIENVASYLLMLAASVAIIFIIIGGYKYIFAFGSPEAIQQAKNTITWAIVGLILILLAILIIQFIEHSIGSTQPGVSVPRPESGADLGTGGGTSDAGSTDETPVDEPDEGEEESPFEGSGAEGEAEPTFDPGDQPELEPVGEQP